MRRKKNRETACSLWVELYGKTYRELNGCSLTLRRALRERRTSIPTAVFACHAILKQAEKDAHGVEAVKACVRAGQSHGVLQPRRMARRYGL